MTVPPTVAPAAGLVTATVGLTVSRTELLTVKLTLAEVRTLPAASAALATTVCAPSATVVLFQVAVHGEPFVSAATSTPSTNHLTEVTGRRCRWRRRSPWRRCRRPSQRRQGRRLTVGAVVSGGGAVWLTEKLTDSEAPQLPAVSRAFAMILCAPSATVALFHGFGPRRAVGVSRDLEAVDPPLDLREPAGVAGVRGQIDGAAHGGPGRRTRDRHGRLHRVQPPERTSRCTSYRQTEW